MRGAGGVYLQLILRSRDLQLARSASVFSTFWETISDLFLDQCLTRTYVPLSPRNHSLEPGVPSVPSLSLVGVGVTQQHVNVLRDIALWVKGSPNLFVQRTHAFDMEFNLRWRAVAQVAPRARCLLAGFQNLAWLHCWGSGRGALSWPWENPEVSMRLWLVATLSATVATRCEGW